MDTRDDIEKIFPEPDDRDEKPACFPGAGNNPFRVPEGYFNTLTDRVVQACEPGKRSMTARRSSLMPALYAAAAVFLFGLAVLAVLLSSEKSNNEPVQLSQIIDSGLKDSLRTGSSLDSLRKASATPDQQSSRALPGESATEIAATPSVRDQGESVHGQVLNNISDEEIIEFLLQEDYDITDLTY